MRWIITLICLSTFLLAEETLDSFIKSGGCVECAKMDYLRSIYNKETDQDIIYSLIQKKTVPFVPDKDDPWQQELVDLPTRWIRDHSILMIGDYKTDVTFLKCYRTGTFEDLCFSAWLEKAQVTFDKKTGDLVLLLVFRDPIVEAVYKDPKSGVDFIWKSHGLRIINPCCYDHSFQIWKEDPAIRVRKKL